VLLRSERGRPGLLRPLPGTRTASDLRPLEATNHRFCRSPNIWDPEEDKRGIDKNGPRTAGPESSESKAPSQGPRKHQRPSRGTPEGGQAKRLKQAGQPSYARDPREGIRMAIVCDGYPEILISRENFVNIQRAIGGLVDELPEEEFTTSSLILTVPKGQPLW